MLEPHWVLVDVDVENKICYVEKKDFCPLSKEAKEAFIEELKLLRWASFNGYKIREMDEKLEASQNIDSEPMRNGRS